MDQSNTPVDDRQEMSPKKIVQINSSINVEKNEGEGGITGTKIGSIYGSVTVINKYAQDGQLPEPEDLTTPEINRQPFEPETIFIPAGTFLMGRNSGDGIPDHETPQGEVYLPAYRIGVYPVTNKEFMEYIHDTKCEVDTEMGWVGKNPPRGQDDYPVRGVTWIEALDYCCWLTAKTRRTYCLPSEAQWEKAARSATGHLYPWGSGWEARRSNAGNADIAPVKGDKGYPAQNDLGLYDLVGNVLQWTTTLWGEKRLTPDPRFTYPWKDDERDNLRANKQIRRILRGSNYADPPESCTCTARRSYLPEDRGIPGRGHGFRVVLIIEGRS